jgi:large subunit ribosomal protein L10
MEEFRVKLLDLYKGKDKKSELMVIKNSLFKVALAKLQKSDEKLSEEDSQMIQDLAKGQTMLLLMPDEWATVLKEVDAFAKAEEGVVFRAGRIEGNVYEQSGLQSLAKLPSKEELVVKIIMSLRSSQTRLVYGLQYNTIKLVNVLKNAGEKGANSAQAGAASAN